MAAFVSVVATNLAGGNVWVGLVAGLATGALLGLAFVPGRARTLRSFWISALGGTIGADGLQTIIPVVALIVLAIAFVIGYSIGVGRWS